MKCGQYDPSYIQYGFISSKNNPSLPYNDQPEIVQIELCEAIAEKYLIQASEKNWVEACLQSRIKYLILYEKLEPFIINLPTSNLAEKNFSILLHSFASQRRNLHLNDN